MWTSSLDRIAIAGVGNVGSALAIQLAARPLAQVVEVTSREHADAVAGMLDAASAFPETVADRFRVVGHLSGAYSVVIVSAGIQPGLGVTEATLLSVNTDIVLRSVESLDLDAKPILVIVGTPVDLVTERVKAKLPGIRVIGFGGELDTARLRFVLRQRGIDAQDAVVIGEHGTRAVPVYSSEASYGEVRKSISSFLSTIKGRTSTARNLASGFQIARLLAALGGRTEVQSVSRVHPTYGVSLTWPWTINEDGATTPVKVAMGPAAAQCLRGLLKLRGATLAER